MQSLATLKSPFTLVSLFSNHPPPPIPPSHKLLHIAIHLMPANTHFIVDMPEIQSRAASHARQVQRSEQEAAKRTFALAEQVLRSMKNGIPDVLDEVKRLENSLTILFPGLDTLISNTNENDMRRGKEAGDEGQKRCKKRAVWVLVGVEQGDFEVVNEGVHYKGKYKEVEEEKKDEEEETISRTKGVLPLSDEEIDDDVEWEEDEIDVKPQKMQSLIAGAASITTTTSKINDEFLDSGNRKRRRQVVEEVGSAPFTITLSIPSRATDVQSSDNAVIIRGMREIHTHLDAYSLPRLIDWLQILNKALRLCASDQGVNNRGDRGSNVCNVSQNKGAQRQALYQEAVQQILQTVQSVNSAVNGRCRQLLS